VPENRKDRRENCFARALLPDASSYGYVADISRAGLRIRIPGDLPAIPAGRQRLTISLEEMAIPAFQVEVECRWSRQELKSTLVGFLVISCLGEEGQQRFESLIEYYASMPH
jgi:hypothetical protein